MKLAFADYTDQSSGALDEFDYKIKASPTMFYVMISALAKDKIGYPIREICTNAWDAAKGDFEVHLPTIWSPEFRVRDYGPGLTHKQMMSLYTTIGGTTKNRSNEEVGGLGIGSKSFFAYLIKGDELGTAGSASVTVRSFQDGRVRSYVMSIASDGRPICRLLGDEETDEKPGLEVSFPVRSEDRHDFIDRARTILWFFEPRPRVEPDLGWEEPVVIRSGTNWVEYTASSVPWDGPHVRMGCVAYSIDTPPQWPWKGQCLLFEAPIGSLSVQASRESLAYDDRTKKTIATLIAEFEATQIAVAEKLIEVEPTYLDACRVWARSTYHPSVRHYLAEKISWKDRRLRSSFEFKTANIRFNAVMGKPSYFVHPGRQKQEQVLDADVLNESRVILVERNSARSAEKLATLTFADDTQTLWFRCASRADVEFLIDKLGGPEVIDLDKIKLPPIPKGPKRKRTIKTMIYRGGGYIPEAEIDLDEGGIFIEIYGVRGGRPNYRSTDWHRFYSAMEDFWKLIPDIVGTTIALPRESQAKKLIGPKWKDAKHWLRERIESEIDFDAPFETTNTHNIPFRWIDEGVIKTFGDPRMPADIRALIEQIRTLKKKGEDRNHEIYELYLKHWPQGRRAPQVIDRQPEVAQMLQTIRERYPLIDQFTQVIYTTPSPETVEAVATYLSLYATSKGY